MSYGMDNVKYEYFHQIFVYMHVTVNNVQYKLVLLKFNIQCIGFIWKHILL